MHKHAYTVSTKWKGNKGEGTSTYRSYERNHTISIKGKPDIEGSSDPAFRGDPAKYNPEEFLVAALSICHMLSYLHVCTMAGVIVTAYEDVAEGKMEETPNGGGHFTEVLLRPIVTVKDASMVDNAMKAHHRASELCFITSSVNFPVHHKPECQVDETPEINNITR